MGAHSGVEVDIEEDHLASALVGSMDLCQPEKIFNNSTGDLTNRLVCRYAKGFLFPFWLMNSKKIFVVKIFVLQ